MGTFPLNVATLGWERTGVQVHAGGPEHLSCVLCFFARAVVLFRPTATVQWCPSLTALPLPERPEVRESSPEKKAMEHRLMLVVRSTFLCAVQCLGSS